MSIRPGVIIGNVWYPESNVQAFSTSITVPIYDFCTLEDLFDPTSSYVINLLNTPKEFKVVNFGLNIQSIEGDYIDLETGWARTHDFKYNGLSARWRHIELTKNVWNWDTLDVFVNYNLNLQRKIIHTLFGTPLWAAARPTPGDNYYGTGAASEPANLVDWINMCQQVATRYKGKITHYEIWNEPQDINYFSGDMPALISLIVAASQTIKTIDSKAKIISPGITELQTTGVGRQYLQNLLQSSEVLNAIDYIGCHLYPATYPKIADIALSSKFIKNLGYTKPIINTEFSCIHPGIANIAPAAKELVIARLLLIALAGDFLASIWYTGTPPQDLTLSKEDYIVFKKVVKLLSSAPISVINVLKDGRIATIIGNDRYIF